MIDHTGNEAGEGLDVAVIGMACRLPGARDIHEFWRNLRDGVESISRWSLEQARARGVPPERLSDPDYVPAEGVLEGFDAFDFEFFGYPPREAQLMDPQQRLFLECAWQAMEHGGFDPKRYGGTIGVFGGSTMNTYLAWNLLSDRRLVELLGEQQLMLSNDKDFLTMRVSHKLGLRGPSYTVQSACSTSLLAVHVACRSLLAEECDMALAGGASVRVPHGVGYVYKEGGTSSRDGRVRAFDERAAGSVAGSGVGVVLLKRLADAVRDGDSIYAVIKGSATSNDGSHKVSFAAPSVDGQARAIAEALAVAQVAPETISYIEAHGTATQLGDPVEVKALAKAFREVSTRQSCALGSVKTNIGHLDAAAGISGLLKTILSLQHRTLPPTLNFQRTNPRLELASTPFHVSAQRIEWKTSGFPRRAGVNSIGMGGSNVHVILEEAPAPAPTDAGRPWQVLPLSARTPTALEAATRNLITSLREHPEAVLADIAWTLQVGRGGFEHRRAVACRGTAEAIAALERRHAQSVAPPPELGQRSLLFMFPGQGAQHVNMGAELFRAEPVFRDCVMRCADVLREPLGFDLLEVLHPASGREAQAQARLQQTAVAQPALFVLEYALCTLLGSWGLRPQAMVGHSVGELVAACVAEVFTLESALRIVAERGRLMQQLPPGGMLAVRLPEAEIAPYLDEKLSLAAVNGPTQCVLSGPSERIQALEEKLARAGVPCQPLRVSHAFHSSMMEPAVGPFQEVVARARPQRPRIRFASSLTGGWIRDEEATDPAYWAAQLCRPVRFADALAETLREGAPLPLEVGPGRRLTPLARTLIAERPLPEPIACMRDAEEHRSELEVLTTALARIWEAHGALDWELLHAGERRRRVPLPTYPFERKRAWLEPSAPVRPEAGARPAPPAAEPASPRPTPQQAVVAGLNARITVLADRIVIETGAGGEVPEAQHPRPLATVPAAPPPPPAPPPSEPSSLPAPGREEIEEKVAALVEQLLGITRVDHHANLVRLGADSLLLVQLLAHLRRTFQVELPMQELLDAGSVSVLATILRERLAQVGPPRPPAPDRAPEDVNEELHRLIDEISRLSPDEARELLAAPPPAEREGATHEDG